MAKYPNIIFPHLTKFRTSSLFRGVIDNDRDLERWWQTWVKVSKKDRLWKLGTQPLCTLFTYLVCNYPTEKRNAYICNNTLKLFFEIFNVDQLFPWLAWVTIFCFLGPKLLSTILFLQNTPLSSRLQRAVLEEITYNPL